MDIGISKANNFSRMIDFHYYHFSSNVDDRTLFSWRLWIFSDCSQYDFKSKIKNKLTFKDILVNPDYAKELAELTGNETVPCLVTGVRPMKEAKDILKYLV